MESTDPTKGRTADSTHRRPTMKYTLASIAIAFCATSSLVAQTSNDAAAFAQEWMSRTCFDADTAREDKAAFARFGAELKPTFLSAIYRQFELNQMQDAEAALGQLYDERMKLL